MITIVEAAFPSDLATVRALFREYAGALNFSLCFQHFDAELAGLPGDCAPPRGRVLLARAEADLAGCVALRPFGNDACEMKRLFVRPAFRGQSAGLMLAERIIAVARELRYPRMLLDTAPQMTAAIALYRALGFRETTAYRENPIPGALFFELSFASGKPTSPPDNWTCTGAK
jgi:ribosomal protein S18 acetylase RimI-like enzyme